LGQPFIDGLTLLEGDGFLAPFVYSCLNGLRVHCEKSLVANDAGKFHPTVNEMYRKSMRGKEKTGE
jgi:hypothetical protein